jgi:hypothetical protein
VLEKPYLITQHVRDFAHAYVAWEDVYERPADEWEFHQLLKFPEPNLELSEGHLEAATAEYAICREALQIVASTLLGQTRQRDNALVDLHSILERENDRRAKRDRERRRARRQKSRKAE